MGGDGAGNPAGAFCHSQQAGVLVNADMGLSARAYHRVLKLGRPIADRAGSEHARQAHLAEVLQYLQIGHRSHVLVISG